MLALERQAWAAGARRVAGVDEAGRGPLAGPVTAAAVIFPPAFAESEVGGLLRGLTDSKCLRPARREAFYELIIHAEAVATCVGWASVGEIDRENILGATRLAMQRALHGLPAPPPDCALVDGRPMAGLPVASTAVVGGDGKSLSIAAASVLAKVSRDRLMVELDRVYPAYGFARHKGYGTAAHLEALRVHGPCPCHRRTFGPLRQLRRAL